MDYRHVRSQPYCPLCSATKANGSLVCWDCYRDFSFRSGAPRSIMNMIDEYETDLYKISKGRKEHA